MPEDLAGTLIANGIARTIVVQSVPEVAETEFLLGLARETPASPVWSAGSILKPPEARRT